MATSTLPGDEKQDEKLNPGQQHADRTFNDISRAEEQGTFDDIANNYDKTADGSQEDANIDKLKERESEGDNLGSWKDNTSGDKSAKSPFSQKAKTFFKKRGGIVGLVVALGLGGGALGGFFGPASMLINLAENATIKNDTSSTAMQHRFMRVFGFSIAEPNPADPVCANTSRTIKCKMGRISNSAINKLEKKGVKAYFSDPEDINNRKKTGYPTKNPAGYTIDLKDGTGTKNIPTKDFIGFLANNPKIAAQVLGRSGAFNVRINAWSGKHITQKLYKKFGLNRNGGLADGSSKNLSPGQKLAEISKKLQDKLPGADKLNAVPDAVKDKIESHLGKASKAGFVYVGAVAGCIAVKAPGYIATGVAAVQLAQVMPVGMDVVLSPGAKAKASGVDTANSITSEDVDSVGTLITNKTPRESDGKMTSSLDSPIFQSAIGVNTAKTAVSKDYTPGYSVLSNPLLKIASDADTASAPACNVIMSTTAMYTATAISTAATIGLSYTIVGGIFKVALDYVASSVISQVAADIAGEAAKTAVIDLATNDKIPKASGEALGDVIGISMMSMFAAGGMARGLPVLKTSQVSAFNLAAAENEAFNKEMDIATMSPFDTSSKYTFLGSIVNNAQLAVLKSGSYNGSLLSSLPGLVNFSKASLSTNTNASDEAAANYCSYAAEFGLTTTDPADTPAINVAGLPCTGFTADQMNMNVDEAINLLVEEKWLDGEAEILDTWSIQNLVTKNIIKRDTPLADYIASCTNAQNGDYILNSAGCTVSEANATSAEDSELPALKNPRSLAAMAVFLLDYQQSQAINGHDEDDGTTGDEGAEDVAPVLSSSSFVLPADTGYSLSSGWGPRSCAGCSAFHKAIDITNYPGGSEGRPVYSVADGEVISADKINGINGYCTSEGEGSNNVVQIKHANGLISVYYHMSANNITVSTGDRVTAGQAIGKIGNCGQSYGAHLHFEFKIGDATDPALLAIGGSDAYNEYRNPGPVMALLGVNVVNGTYTDGR